ncbi:MAG: type II secretion system protein [Oscillospiraceae bacterium]|nr:type II secretion system protein [Oscillospiraceae bacterium]
MKRNNRGFTLVELVVALAILGILSAAVIGFVSTGASAYRSVSASVNLQTESQLCMNQIQQYLIDCNGGVSFVDDSLYILNREDDGGWWVHAFQFRGGTLYYSKNSVTNDEGSYACTVADGDKLSGHVASFTADTGPAGTAAAVTLTIGFENSGKTYSAAQTTALRNSVCSAVSLETLLGEVCG